MRHLNLCILLSISSTKNTTIITASNTHDGETTSIQPHNFLLRGSSSRSLVQSQQTESSSPVVRPNIFNPNDNDNDNNSTTVSLPLMEPYTEDPFKSNVHEFINTTHIISQPIDTISPSISPPPTFSPHPTALTVPIHPPPSSSLTVQTLLPTTSTTDETEFDDNEFKEFIAFVGWYAFLILCCILPTICTYYKRRRNAYLLNENISSIRLRLEEMERYNTVHGERGGFAAAAGGGGEGGGAGSVLRLGENNQDWEVLESLFGTNTHHHQHPNNNVERATTAVTIATLGLMDNENDPDRRRQIMSDILLGGMSVRNVMEREQRRKRERGRRLVSLLKECSLWVKESHLIPKEEDDVGGDGMDGGLGGEYGGQKEEDGDIELGTVFTTVQTINNDDKKGEENDNDCNEKALESNPDAEGSQKIAGKSDDDLESSSRMNDGDEEEACQQSAADEINDDAASASLAATTASNAEESTTNHAAIDTTNTQSSSSLLPSTTADNSATMSNNNSSILSLYQTDDIYIDDDDDDNKYTALCLPCSPTHNNAITTTTATCPVAARSAPQSTIDNNNNNESSSSSTRLVPPTCAICLLSYSPGCYVTWSSNPECIHVFHRDCILVWLLKKEEPLCPCCRREFVSTSALNAETATDAAAENDEEDNRLEQYRRSIMLLERSQSMAAMRRASNSHSRRSARFARMSMQEHTTPPNWDSVGLGRVRHF